MGWKKIDGGPFHGTLAKGDKTMPPTRWWNRRILQQFFWRKVTIYMVPEGIVCYRVGFKPQTGPAKLNDEIMTSRKFAVYNGFEDCIFFALDSAGREFILLELEQSRDDCLPAGVPLI